MEDAGAKDNPAVGTIVYRPMQGLTREQRACEATFQTYPHRHGAQAPQRGRRYVRPHARLYRGSALHPFAPHDDLIDAVSRIYDMEPKKPNPFESQAQQAPVRLCGRETVNDPMPSR
jgi:hypothetical protein